ncbi:hypothetical protein [Agrilutibacter solisilvae]|uniref:Uncharacterized protein n=1 Tax=Agrilutibacter solisilvae TaxID=2763317 RepID=A0A974Y5Y9_9GAMM|nr:hypothetical protein [Lysobacter solisilvae]QSX79156.1 hypothetical protein I8J32_004475 [Lysobacter solisilvae]
MTALSPFERRIVDACLAGDAPVLAALRTQADQAAVERREDTGDGLRTYFVLPDTVAAVEPAALNFTDVDLDIAGVDDGASTSLWVIGGRLAFLEVLAYDGPWPACPELRGLRYLREVQIAPGTWSATPVDARDPDTLARALAGVQADEYGG